MTSNQAHLIMGIGQGLNGLAALCSQLGVIPHIPVQYNVIIVAVLAGIGHWVIGFVTPNTNSSTPDNTPIVVKTVVPSP